MAKATLTETWDNMAVTTFARRGPEMTKQTIESFPLLKQIETHPIVSGMFRIEKPLEIGRNVNGGYLQNPDGKVELSDNDVASMAVYTPSLLVVPVKFNRIEKIRNSGREQFKDLMVLKTNQAKRSMREILAANLYGKGDNFKTLGLGAAVPADPTATTIGGVPVAHKYWQSLTRTLGSWATNGHLGTTNDYMFNMFLYVTVDGLDGTFIVSDFNCYERYHRALGQNVRYIDSEGPTEILNKPRTLSYQGLPWYPDRMCDADTIFFLNRNDYEWHVAPGMNFEPTEMMPVPERPLVSYMALILFHQWVWKRRNRSARVSGVAN